MTPRRKPDPEVEEDVADVKAALKARKETEPPVPVNTTFRPRGTGIDPNYVFYRPHIERA